jgi:hypothetical protein
MVGATSLGHAHQTPIRTLLTAEDNNCDKQARLYRVRAKKERGAWAFAVCTLRRLEKDGFNVFAGFHGRGEVRQFIIYKLLTYEIGRRSSLFELGGQPALDKARPLFVRGQGSP